MTIGVLALQADFDAHRRRLQELGAEVVLPKSPSNSTRSTASSFRAKAVELAASERIVGDKSGLHSSSPQTGPFSCHWNTVGVRTMSFSFVP